jgi:DNA-binding MarR family transcriptional regulator
MPQNPADPADAIAAALARLRGRRMPRPPWENGPHGHGSMHHGHAGSPWGDGHRGRGPGPWGGPPRIGGPARMRLLEALAAASHPLSVGEIADAVGVDQPRASRLVQQAFQLDLVRREADPEDARRTRVALTDAGAALVRGFRGERREAIDTALSGFSDAERADLARLLTKLADAWPAV